MTAQAPDLRSVRARRSFFENARRTLATAPLSAWFGMIVIVIYVIAAVFAPWLAPYGESDVVGKAYQPSGPEFWLGTDQIGHLLAGILDRLVGSPAKRMATRCRITELFV